MQLDQTFPKQLGKAHVCPILFGIKPTDLEGPLRQCQATEFEKSDFSKLLSVINSCLDENKLVAKTLEKVFEKWWPDLEENVATILESSEDFKSDEPIRSDRDMLEELLQITRMQHRSMYRARRQPISPGLVKALLDGCITLHNQQANTDGDYQETLDYLRKMHEPIEVLLKQTSRTEELLDLIEQFQNLPYAVSGGEIDEEGGDVDN